MKTKVHFTFDADNIPGEAAAILTPSGCGPDVADVSDYTILNIRTVRVRIKLDETDERVARVFALLKQYGVEVDSFTYDEYSEEDRQNARLLRMGPSSSYDKVFHSSFSPGTKYDMTEACANCGTGARQTSALYVDGDDLPEIRKQRAIGSWAREIIVDGGMVKKLKDASVTGISFGDVRARLENGKWTSVAREQILIEHVLPPMHGKFGPADEQKRCKVCRRGGRSASPDKPYREEDLVGMKDFNRTWECFGEFWPENKETGIGEKRPCPSILVTPKVMNIFREAGVKTFDWTPVGLEG